MILIQAINKKNQTTVNKAVKYLVKYNGFNDLRTLAEDTDDTKAALKWERKCEHTFDMFLEYMEELPKGQQTVIYKSTYYTEQ